MKVLETDRLVLRHLSVEDAEFILELLNEPSFLRHIGDKGVRTLDDARLYILRGPAESYERRGFGLFATVLKEGEVPIGICGILKRETLDHPDLGFAFLPQFWSRGYALEAASAVMDWSRDSLQMSRVLAVTSPDNDASIRLLGKLGFEFEGRVSLTQGEPEVHLFRVGK